MMYVRFSGFAALAIVVALVASMPTSAQTVAPPDCVRPTQENENVTWTFYRPNQSCSFVIFRPRLFNVTIVDGKSDLITVTPDSGISQMQGSTGTKFTGTSGPKAGKTTFIIHQELDLPQFENIKQNAPKAKADFKVTVVNKY